MDMKLQFSRRFKITCGTTVLIGLAAHLFALTNVLKNHDNIIMTGYGAGTASGRWFMGWIGDVIQEVWGNYNIPFFNGLLGIFLLAAGAYLGVLIFDIRDYTLCILWGGLFVAFPSVTSLMFYMYAVPYYAAAILMTMAAVYWTDRYRFGWIGAIFLLALSLGIYQAYYPLAVGLYVTILIVRSLTGRYSVKEAIRKAFLYLGILAASMAAYFVVLKLRLNMLNLQLNTYKNIDKMGQIKLSEIPDMISRTYREFFGIPLDDYYQMSATQIISWMLIALAVLSIAMILLLLLRGGRKGLRERWPAFVFLTLYPAAVNSITLMCYHSKIYTLMIFAGVLVYLLPLLLVSELGKYSCSKKPIPRFFPWIRLCACGALGLVLLNYIWQSNGNYITMYYTDQQMYYYLNSMVTQVKETDGFNTDLKWAFIGSNVRDPLRDNPWKETPFWYGGNKKQLINEYSRKNFFSQILGYNIPWASQEEIQALAKNETIQAMATYPNDGSIAVVGDIVVIKLEEIKQTD